MKIPHKLKHDYLRDAILEIRFQSDYSEELIPGILKSQLEGFDYIPPRQERHHVSGAGTSIMSVSQSAGLFVKPNQPFRLKYIPGHPGSLSINMTDRYSGWRDYLGYVDEVFASLREEAVISNIIQIGLRYVSVHPIDNIFDVIRGECSIALYGYHSQSEQKAVRIEDTADDIRRTVQLANTKGKDNDLKGIFDIDVRTHVTGDKKNLSEPEVFRETLDRMHDLQKRTYFGLLTESYLDSLGPEYK